MLLWKSYAISGGEPNTLGGRRNKWRRHAASGGVQTQGSRRGGRARHRNYDFTSVSISRLTFRPLAKPHPIKRLYDPVVS